MKGFARIVSLLCFACLFALAGCGYHTAGHADLLPKNIKTIAIPAFGNVTTRYKLPDFLTRAITREFIERTRYQVIDDAEKADAILLGSVVNFSSYPTIFDPKTGRASGVQAIVNISVSLQDRETGAALFSRPNLEFRARYEISTDEQVYFDESEAAMDRLSRDAARFIVSAILEKF
jgi:outer membrane lipopolysaccharide assembly protein LptE/RlpB